MVRQTHSQAYHYAARNFGDFHLKPTQKQRIIDLLNEELDKTISRWKNDMYVNHPLSFIDELCDVKY